jgi:site-specific recombinase XerD
MSIVGTLNSKKTDEWLNRTLGTLNQLPTSTANTSLGGQLQIFLLTCKVNGLSPRTLSDYGEKIGRFVAFCEAQSINEPGQVTPQHVKLFLLFLQERIKASSVHDYYGCVHRFVNWLVEEEILEESPMERMHPPKVPRQVIQPFTRDHIIRMLTVCGDTFLGCRNQAIIFTFLDTGLRLSELAGIQLSDLDFDNGTIKVMGKGSKERRVRISPETQKAILRYLLRCKNGHLSCLWLTGEHKPLRARGISSMVRRLGERAGIRHEVRTSSHTFRHTAAIQYLRNRGDQFTLQIMLGHNTLEMTRRYVSTLGVEDMLKVHQTASPVENWKL